MPLARTELLDRLYQVIDGWRGEVGEAQIRLTRALDRVTQYLEDLTRTLQSRQEDTETLRRIRSELTELKSKQRWADVLPGAVTQYSVEVEDGASVQDVADHGQVSSELAEAVARWTEQTTAQQASMAAHFERAAAQLERLYRSLSGDSEKGEALPMAPVPTAADAARDEELRSLREARTELADQLTALRAESENLARRHMQNLEGRPTAEDHAALLSERDTFRDELVVARAEVDTLRREQSLAEREQEALAATAASAQARADGLVEKLARLEEAQRSSQAALEERDERLTRVTQEKGAHESARAVLESELEELREKLRARDVDVKRLEAALDDREDQVAELAGASSDSEPALSSEAKGRLQSIVDAMGQQVDRLGEVGENAASALGALVQELPRAESQSAGTPTMLAEVFGGLKEEASQLDNEAAADSPPETALARDEARTPDGGVDDFLWALAAEPAEKSPRKSEPEPADESDEKHGDMPESDGETSA